MSQRIKVTMRSESINSGVSRPSLGDGVDEGLPLMSVVPPAVIAQARALLSPGQACVLDCETTGLGGSIVEIAAVAADTGEVLFDSLVDPGGVAFEPEARRINGISDVELVGASRWDQVYPNLVAAIGNRRIAAYNAHFDHGRIMHDCARYEIHARTLVDFERWECVMALRSAAHCSDERLRLDAGHRALGDVQATREVLYRIAQGIAA